MPWVDVAAFVLIAGMLVGIGVVIFAFGRPPRPPPKPPGGPTP